MPARHVQRAALGPDLRKGNVGGKDKSALGTRPTASRHWSCQVRESHSTHAETAVG